MRHGHTVGVGLFLGRLSPSETFASQNFGLGQFQKSHKSQAFQKSSKFTKIQKIQLNKMSKFQKS